MWYDIPGYEGLYQITKKGEVRSKDRIIQKKNKSGKINDYLIKGCKRKICEYSNGYLFVPLRKNKHTKNELLHRLLAKTFISNPNKLPCVNHIDGNKKNNDLSNLEFCSFSYNIKHAIEIGLVKNQCKIIKSCIVIDKDSKKQILFESMKDVCDFFGFTKSWLNNYSKKNGNPCEYKHYSIRILERGWCP